MISPPTQFIRGLPVRFQPELDALRGMCIAAVFLTHTHFLDCGWVGVQAFFVLSGYLITGILLESRETHGTAASFFGNFYARRALRIFPVYFAYVAVTLIIPSLMVSEPTATVLHATSAQNLPYLLSYTVNVFEGFSSTLPLNPFYAHLWSLSIEEQFYLIWPLLVFFTTNRRLKQICVTLVAVGIIIRLLEYLWIDPPPAQRLIAGRFVYFFTPSQFDAFAFGALLNFRGDALIAKLLRLATRWVPASVALLGLVVLLLAQLAHEKIGLTSLGWSPFLPYFYASVWGYTLLDALFAVIIANLHALPALAKNRFLQRLGRISYGFYIFHYPTLWAAHEIFGIDERATSLGNLGTSALAFAVTWFLAEISFRYLETPFLNLKRHFASRPVAEVAQAAEA